MRNTFLKASSSIEVGDRVKIKSNERTGSACVASRYGYVVKLDQNEASVEFHDYTAVVIIEDLILIEKGKQ
jgi:hypothetical protein